VGSAIPNILIGGTVGGTALPMILCLFLSMGANGQAGIAVMMFGLPLLLFGVGVGGGMGLLLCRGKGLKEERGTYVPMAFLAATVIAFLVLIFSGVVISWLHQG
jgi:hypothetical protein